MKLLIVTQVVDINHPILGFFHRWIEEFAKHCEKVTVICLEAGKHSLPANVAVHSLGKEQGISKVGYLVNFYQYIWCYRNDYDSIFVHMNQIYVILGGFIWRLLNKKIGLWYTHGTVSWQLRIATFFTHKVFTASEDSFRLQSKKKVVTGHGIDTDIFKPLPEEKTIDLVTVGRISPSKNLEHLLMVLGKIRKKFPTTLTIVGSTIDAKGEEYEASLRNQCRALNIEEAVTFYGPVKQANLPKVLNQAKVFVTASQTGSLDKVVLEAMACGLPIVSSAPGTTSLPLGESQVKDEETFASQIMKVIDQVDPNFSGNHMGGDNVMYIEENHSLESLVVKLCQKYVT